MKKVILAVHGGAGTWADRYCAVSATGEGEKFMRCVFAHDVSALMQYGHLNLQDACQQALDHVAQLQGEGGCIALDNQGNLCAVYNTKHMYRGWAEEDGVVMAMV